MWNFEKVLRNFFFISLAYQSTTKAKKWREKKIANMCASWLMMHTLFGNFLSFFVHTFERKQQKKTSLM